VPSLLLDEGTFNIDVGSDSSLGETCGICGSQSGELIYRNGTAVEPIPAEQQRLVESYRVEAAEMMTMKPECGEFIACNAAECGTIKSIILS
jgi:hypothetical protein